MQIDNTNATANGKEVRLDIPAVIINGRTLAPVKFIEETTGAKVTWNENTKIVWINIPISNIKEYKNSLTYSNLLDHTSQDEVRKAMRSAEIPTKSIDFFFEEVNDFNSIIEGTSLVEHGFTTIDSLEPDYDWITMLEMWDAENPIFLGYNCRITTYDLMKDSIHIGKTDTKNASWLVFDENAIENNPKELFNSAEHEEFQTLLSFIPAENTKDIFVHLKKVQEDWKNKEIEFDDKGKSSIISVFFHDYEDYLFIGHMGVLIPTDDGKLLFIEKLSFQAPYQAVKFDDRIDLNDYLMNKYDISRNQPTAKPFIMENGQLLEGYRGNPNNLESDSE